jgi:hypothetical protein
MNKRMRSLMNQSNAQHYRSGLIPEMSGGVQQSWSGKPRSRMNAFKHNLTGDNLILPALQIIENNVPNFDMMHPRRTEAMLAQTRAWKDDARTFDILGQLQSEPDMRLSAAQALSAAALPSMDTRLPAASSSSSAQVDQKAALTPEMASFGRIPLGSPTASCPVP